MIDLFLSNNRVAVFVWNKKKKKKKKIQITDNTWRAFQLLEAVISSASGQIHFSWKIFVNTNLKVILEDIFLPGACNVNPLLRNLGYNNNSAQNQNVFQTATWNLLGISSVNITFSNKSVP